MTYYDYLGLLFSVSMGLIVGCAVFRIASSFAEPLIDAYEMLDKSQAVDRKV